MPPFIIAAGAFLLGFTLFKAAKKKVQADLEAVRKGEPIERGTLEEDPVTGQYRVRD